MRAVLFIAGLTVAAAGCGRGSAPPGPAPLSPVAIDAQLFQTNDGGIADSAAVAIRDAANLQDWWRRATASQSTPSSAPAVDFQRHMVLLVSGGRMPAGYDVRIDSVGMRRERNTEGRMQDMLHVYYTFSHACRLIARDAHPVEIVRIRREERVIFNGHRDPPAVCR
jgi:hypothetical protein